MKGNDPSVTHVNFSFYLNTKAFKSLCYGPGINHDQATGIPTSFVIQSRNEYGENRKSGMDEIRI